MYVKWVGNPKAKIGKSLEGAKRYFTMNVSKVLI